MGTTTVSLRAPAMSEADLASWFNDRLEDMAREGGTDAYCGNWNSCQGLRVVSLTGDEASVHGRLDQMAEKRGSVLAARVGDFGSAFPSTATDKDVERRLGETRRQIDLFDLGVLERAQAAKSKTKKCPRCESSITVRMMSKPTAQEIATARCGSGLAQGVFTIRGAYALSHWRGVTSCPVCSHELLRTPTDAKALAALEKKSAELSAKLDAARAAHAKRQTGKPQPFWLVLGACGS